MDSLLDMVLFTNNGATRSFTGYHLRGLDYLCLMRTPGLTIKAYFFDEAIDGEAVAPHNHRYDFDTRVLRGGLSEVRWSLYSHYEIYETRDEYSYLASDVGGPGSFHFARHRNLARRAYLYTHGDTYSNRAHEDIHSLENIAAGTVLLLNQYADLGPAGTRTFFKIGEKPDLDGLYQPMSSDYIERRTAELADLLEGRA